ncbi:thioesterase domain-containing protein [Streptomyces sp. SA15]|uniref:thioesterase II family protein n=1 Tax=Streptomyces sp. SA15 TaxID=934019 RepID=UPI00211C3AE6|nr:thioesterase domain-containing protein [Streptomyces sp. SA15]
MRATSTVFQGRPVADPRLRLFVFHHAGGSHVTYRALARELPEDWEVCLVDAPGRGRLTHEEPLAEPRSLVDRVHDDLLVWLDRPFAFFGHSMGGLLCHDLTLRLDRDGLPLPRWLGLSARGAPAPDGGTGEEQRHLLPSAELRAVIARLGGTPEAVLRDDELWSLVEPVLRADLRIVETWRFDAADRLPPVPLAVFGGTHDPMVTPARLAAWADRTSAFQGLRLFPGHHFYFTAQLPQTATRIAADVHAALDTAWQPRR